MEGNNRIWVWWVMKIWLCLGSTLVVQSSPPTLENTCFVELLPFPISTTDHINSHTIVPRAVEYPVLPFPISTNINYQIYHEFLETLRRQVGDPNNIIDGIPVLRNRNTLRIQERFLLVQLRVEEREHFIGSVTLALNVSNLYVLGFRVEDRAYFFYGTPAEVTNNLFIDAANRNPNRPNDIFLSFTENYGSLEGAARHRRHQIDLGSGPLVEAVRNLYMDSVSGITRQEPTRTARSLIVCIEMISEAARNYLIEGRISTRIYNSEISPADPEMISYMGYWGRISSAFQHSNQGALNNSIPLRNRNNEVITVHNLNDYCVRSTIALIQYFCEPRRETRSSRHIRSVAATDDAVCEVTEEPTVHIVGPNGLCADVKHGDYSDGNAIILWPCKSNTDTNQLWTLKRDGTIRSNGKCLASYGSSPGCYVMIFDCTIAAENSTKWQVLNDGTIVYPVASLVLSGKEGESGTELKVETNNLTISQSWRPTHNIQPSMASIVGFKGLCLHASGKDVWVQKCASDNEEQIWALYADGSIRPQQNRYSCLSTDESGIIVEVLPCETRSAGQRWQFKSGSIIMNLYYGKVLDVAYSDPEIKRIIIYPFTGTANQWWSAVF